jgi:hypothetical protein
MIQKRLVYLIWALTIIVELAILIFTPKDNQQASTIAFLSSTIICTYILVNHYTLVSISLMATILIVYVDREFFPVSGFIVIGGCLFWSFVMVGVLATDLAFTLHN